MKFQQTTQEIEEIVTDLKASYKEKGRVMADDDVNGRHNGIILMKWLEENFTKNGLTDGSFQNMRKAIAELHAKGLIKWEKEPAPKEKPKRVDDLNDQINTAIRDARNQAATIQNENDLECLRNAANIVRTHNNFPHSRAAKEKAALAAEFDKQQALLEAGKQTAAGLLAAVRKLKESF